jgi:small-conductance mechanosensitive channel
MSQLLEAARAGLLSPSTPIGAALWAVLFFLGATLLAALIRRVARRIEQHLSDRTGLRFVSAFAQLLAFLVAFILYAHLVPALRALGTTLLAGVSVVSVVVGLAAQDTLGNLVAGFSLVLYRPVRVGDSIQLSSPKGVVTATVQVISLGYTVLADGDGNAIIVPNSVMANSVVIRLGEARRAGQVSPAQ